MKAQVYRGTEGTAVSLSHGVQEISIAGFYPGPGAFTQTATLTPTQARRVAKWLLQAADVVEKK